MLPIAVPLAVVLALALVAQTRYVSSFLAEVGDAVFGRGRVLVTVGDPKLSFDSDLLFSAEGEAGSFVYPRRGGLAFFRLKAGRYTFSVSKGGRTLGRREFMVKPDATQSLQIPVDRPRPATTATSDLGTWGQLVAPARGSHATIDANRLTLATPANAPNDLNPTPGRSLDAPRVLQPVAGDFLYRVRLLPPDWPGDLRVTPGGTYHWSGLVVWAGERDFLRFGISRNTHHEAGMPLLNVQSYRDGRDTERDNIFAPPGPVWLQVERRGDALTFRTSEDGQAWSDHKTLTIAGLPVRLRVGVGAINTGVGAFAASFEDGSLASPNPPASAPSALAAGSDLGPWGRLVDPIGDVRAVVRGAALTIAMPAGPFRDLNPMPDPSKNLDAPRVLRPVAGDFVAQVQLPALPRPADVTLDGRVRHEYFFQGLVLWASERDFVRFGVSRNSEFHETRPLLDLQFFRDLRDVEGDVRFTPDAPVHLQAERRGDTLYLRTSPDGRDWSTYKTCSVAGMPPRVFVGVAPINTGLRAFAAQFEGWSLRTTASAIDLAPWGRLVDPRGDVIATRDGDRLTIALPADSPRDLNASTEPGKNLNAPRVLQDVRGDFAAEVTIQPTPRPLDNATPALSGPSYHFTGLVVWAGPRDFLRFGVSRNSQYGGGPMFDLEYFRDRRDVIGATWSGPDGPVRLRAERRGNLLTLQSSVDGREWTTHRTADLAGMPAALAVGVAAIDTGLRPLEAQFEGWSLRPIEPAAAADAPTRLRLVDPLGGSRIALDDGRIALALPGGASRDLNPGPNSNLDAPRYLRPVAGDFTARVAIPPLPRPRPEASHTKDGNTFLWAGLVAWAGGRDFVRLGVGRSSVVGDAAPTAHLEYFRDGKPVQARSAWVPAGTTHLLMQRRGDTLAVKYSFDGRNWMGLGPVVLAGLPATLDVGVAAINTGGDPVDVAFDGWAIGPETPPY